MTDIARLHDSLGCNARRCGKTRALLHSIIGEIQIGWNKQILLFCNHRDIQWLKLELWDALIEQEVEVIKRKNNQIFFRNQDGGEIVLTFVTTRDKNETVGYKDTAYFELDK